MSHRGARLLAGHGSETGWAARPARGMLHARRPLSPRPAVITPAHGAPPIRRGIRVHDRPPPERPARIAGEARGSGRETRPPYGEKETVSGISVMPLYFSIASFIRRSLWPRRLFHSAHQFRKFLNLGSVSERIPK